MRIGFKKVFVCSKRRLVLLALFVVSFIALIGVAGSVPPAAYQPEMVFVHAAQKIPATMPQLTGVTEHKNEKASIDASNLSEGYVIIKYTGGKPVPIKVQITKSGGATYTYDLSSTGSAEIFPLSEGDGDYTVNIYENVQGNKYALAYGHTLSLRLRDSFLPFMYTNQYVSYTPASSAVQYAATITAGAANDFQKLEKIYDFVVKNFSYDYALAKAPPTGYIPNLDAVFASKKGICFDYASLASAMLRSQGIPTKLVIGYAGTAYHAWINVFVENVGWIEKAIYFDGEKFTLLDPTFASSAESSPEVYKYIGDGTNYTVKYVR
ncbi:MAG: transglutaminase-like domain-containing protein [Clostridiales Family XIII bacterium]|jgi:hypothetical protein|nr:transglutaminase-like domain-containing protein [Clostridiales Family XIII bacterium]